MSRALSLLFSWIWLLIFAVAPLAIILAIALALPADSVPPFRFATDLSNFAFAAHEVHLGHVVEGDRDPHPIL